MDILNIKINGLKLKQWKFNVFSYIIYIGVRNVKKILSIILMSILAIGLIGCSGKESKKVFKRRRRILYLKKMVRIITQ